MKNNNIPNQIFIGCPWKTIRPKYEKIIDDFRKKFPLSFLLVGRTADQNAEDLLSIIKNKLFSSSHAVFDASGGNANVSLEYGLAEANEIPRAIYITKHKMARNPERDSAIISDLAGKKRNEYKQVSGLSRLLMELAKEHSYTKKFERFLKSNCKHMNKGKKKTFRTLALKAIHYLDDKEKARRTDLVQDLAGEGYKEDEVNVCIKNLHKAGLIRCTEGRYSDVLMGT